MRIGFIDSGIGGLTTMRECVKTLGGGEFVYLADELNAPYGTKKEGELLQIGIKNVEFLKRLGASVIVLACNTLTSTTANKLRSIYEEITFVGVEPAILPAVKENLKVALLCTPLTAGSSRVKELLSLSRGKVSVYPISSLAGIIENTVLDYVVLEKYVKNNLKYLSDFDAVVLGCTHYVYLAPYIKKIYPNLKIYDGNLGVATRLKSIVGEQKSPLKYLFFDSNGKQSEKCRKIFVNFSKKF